MSSSHQQARLIVHGPDTGPLNMSIDQAILEGVAATSTPTLRFYRWNPATLSVGYFQKTSDRSLHLASVDCPIVRRASGGGAIVHDDEITYSLCITTAGSIAKANAGLYDTVHLAIQNSLKEQGITVSLYEAPANETVKASADDPFLCFQRRAVGDIICDGSKVGGSAQRRLKNALIQHGSLLLSQSSCAPELPGLRELAGKSVDTARLIAGINSRVAQSLQIQFSPAELLPEEVSRAAEIADKKFASSEWTNRR